MAFCAECGTEVTAGSRYCANCGSLVSGESDTSDAPTERIRRPSEESIAVGEQRLLHLLRQVTLGEYEILGEIGRGGMAVVYLAHDISLDRKVAVKVMSPALTLMDPDIQERFKREARTAAGLSHPHIIPVYAVRESNDIVYFVMKYIAGRALDTVIQEIGPLPTAMVQMILTQVGSALGHAHRKGVVHRDVKPANIMLDEGGWVVVTDFGIAKVSEKQGLTMTGGVIGTPAYMSPEQCAGQDITGAADQYSLGVAAFEMLTGRKPFDSATSINLMYDHCHTPPPSLTDLRPDCPPELAAAVMRMLAKDPAARFATVEEAVAAVGVVSDSQSGYVRTEMLTLAQEGHAARIIEKFHTPRSPAVAPGKAHRASATPDSAPVAAQRLKPRKRTIAGRLPVVGVFASVVVVAAGWLLLGDRSQTDEAQATPPREVSATPPQAEPASSMQPTAPPPTVATLEVDPPSISLIAGETAFLSGTAHDATGNIVAGAQLGWETSDASVATVDSTGLVTARRQGTTLVTVRADGATARVGITVAAPVVAASPQAPVRRSVEALRVSPASGRLSVGQSMRLTASAVDASGRVLSGRRVEWTVRDPGVATVSPTGVVTALTEGTTTITARSEGRSNAISLSVIPIPVATVSVEPSEPTLEVGQAVRLQATPRDAAGNALERVVRWRSTDQGVASVREDGELRAIAAGSSTVIATVDGRSRQVTVVVTEPARAAPAIDAETRIREALESYRVALESEDFGQVRRAYPGLTAQQEDSWRGFFSAATEVRVDFQILDLTVQGDGSATARVRATLHFRTSQEGNETSDFLGSFELKDGTWTLVRVQ